VEKFQIKSNFKFQNPSYSNFNSIVYHQVKQNPPEKVNLFCDPFDQLRKKIQKTVMKLIETMNKKKRNMTNMKKHQNLKKKVVIDLTCFETVSELVLPLALSKLKTYNTYRLRVVKYIGNSDT
jgi:hypothetical protein